MFLATWVVSSHTQCTNTDTKHSWTVPKKKEKNWKKKYQSLNRPFIIIIVDADAVASFLPSVLLLLLYGPFIILITYRPCKLSKSCNIRYNGTLKRDWKLYRKRQSGSEREIRSGHQKCGRVEIILIYKWIFEYTYICNIVVGIDSRLGYGSNLFESFKHLLLLLLLLIDCYYSSFFYHFDR